MIGFSVAIMNTNTLQASWNRSIDSKNISTWYEFSLISHGSHWSRSWFLLFIFVLTIVQRMSSTNFQWWRPSSFRPLVGKANMNVNWKRKLLFSPSHSRIVSPRKDGPVPSERPSKYIKPLVYVYFVFVDDSSNEWTCNHWTTHSFIRSSSWLL